MAATKMGSIAAVLLVLPVALALGSYMKRAQDCPPVCAILHREFNSMNCSDPELGPQRNVSCQEKYYRICKNSCTNTPPTDLECYRASGYFVHSDTCEQIDNKIAQLKAERLEKGCQENHENVLGVRLVGGSGPNEGRVEVKHNDTWGRLCDYRYGTTDAKVVCRMAGFESENPVAWQANAHHFGRGDLGMMVYYMECDGTEPHLMNCSSYYTSYPWGVGQQATCSSNDRGAGVTCQ